MTIKEELLDYVSLLSERECSLILGTVKDVAVGDRFWDRDVAVFYHERTKVRAMSTVLALHNLSSERRNENRPNSESGIYAAIPINRTPAHADVVMLPRDVSLEARVDEILINRRSRRDYLSAQLSGHGLSALLRYACGMSGASSAYGYERLSLRTYPSAGGLQSSEVYVVVQHVMAITPGIYHYVPTEHSLQLLRNGDFRDQLSDSALGQPFPFLPSASAVIVVTGNYDRLNWKYGPRAYRYMCMDAGFVAQNLHLCAEALALGACSIAGFLDDEIAALLNIRPKQEWPLLLVAVGRRSDIETGEAS